jgi:hypothetical protein
MSDTLPIPAPPHCLICNKPSCCALLAQSHSHTCTVAITFGACSSPQHMEQVSSAVGTVINDILKTIEGQA